MKCIFCGKHCNPQEGEHHIIPIKVKSVMGWTGKRSNNLGRYKVAMCGEHHRLFHELIKPLLYIIKNRSVQKLDSVEVLKLVQQIHSSFQKMNKDE